MHGTLHVMYYVWPRIRPLNMSWVKRKREIKRHTLWQARSGRLLLLSQLWCKSRLLLAEGEFERLCRCVEINGDCREPRHTTTCFRPQSRQHKADESYRKLNWNPFISACLSKEQQKLIIRIKSASLPVKWHIHAGRRPNYKVLPASLSSKYVASLRNASL